MNKILTCCDCKTPFVLTDAGQELCAMYEKSKVERCNQCNIIDLTKKGLPSWDMSAFFTSSSYWTPDKVLTEGVRPNHGNFDNDIVSINDIFEDKILNCCSCKSTFVFTKLGQQHYSMESLEDPRECHHCYQKNHENALDLSIYITDSVYWQQHDKCIQEIQMSSLKLEKTPQHH